MEEAPLSPPPDQGPSDGEAPHQQCVGGLSAPARAPGQRGKDRKKRRSPRRLCPSEEEIEALGPIEASRRYIFGKLSLTVFNLAWEGYRPKDIALLLEDDVNKIKVTLHKLRKRGLYVPYFENTNPGRKDVLRLFIKLVNAPFSDFHAFNVREENIMNVISQRLDLNYDAVRHSIHRTVLGPRVNLDPALRLAVIDAYILYWSRANARARGEVVERLRTLRQQLLDQCEQAAPTCPSPHPGPAQQHCG